MPPPILNAPPDWKTLSSTLTLWHGCTSEDAKRILTPPYIDLSKSRPDADYGRGFYTTTIERQARHWAWQKYYAVQEAEQGGENSPMIVGFRIPRERLAALNALYFVVNDYNDDVLWSLIHHCRKSTADSVLDHLHPTRSPAWYDVVAGPIAANWRQRTAIAGADQISFHTDAALAVIIDATIGKQYRTIPI